MYWRLLNSKTQLRITNVEKQLDGLSLFILISDTDSPAYLYILVLCNFII